MSESTSPDVCESPADPEDWVDCDNGVATCPECGTERTIDELFESGREEGDVEPFRCGGCGAIIEIRLLVTHYHWSRLRTEPLGGRELDRCESNTEMDHD